MRAGHPTQLPRHQLGKATDPSGKASAAGAWGRSTISGAAPKHRQRGIWNGSGQVNGHFAKHCIRGQALEVVMRAQPLPKLVVFDLDYTLWPFWCEMHSPEDVPTLFPEAEAVLDALREHSIALATASRTPTPRTAEAFMRRLGITDKFDSHQLIPASSGFDASMAQKHVSHFPALQRETGVQYNQMLFFDDEPKNVHRVAKLGVTSVLVAAETGVSVDVLRDGLQRFAAAHA